MIAEFVCEAPPLRREESGAIRVGQSRVLLELVIELHQAGDTPEEIVEAYSTATLPDVYAVIAYYLNHKGQVEAYMAEREEKAREVWAKLEASGHARDMTEIRNRLAAARAKSGC